MSDTDDALSAAFDLFMDGHTVADMRREFFANTPGPLLPQDSLIPTRKSQPDGIDAETARALEGAAFIAQMDQIIEGMNRAGLDPVPLDSAAIASRSAELSDNEEPFLS